MSNQIEGFIQDININNNRVSIQIANHKYSYFIDADHPEPKFKIGDYVSVIYLEKESKGIVYKNIVGIKEAPKPEGQTQTTQTQCQREDIITRSVALKCACQLYSGKVQSGEEVKKENIFNFAEDCVKWLINGGSK